MLIISDIGKEYTVKSDKPLRVGQILQFMPSGNKGRVNYYNKNQTYVISSEEVAPTDTSVEFYKWWNLQEPSSAMCLFGLIFFKPSEEEAVFKAELSPTFSTSAGSIGWDLWFKTDSQLAWAHLLKGNDLQEQNVCEFKQPGAMWPRGTYLFKATLFYRTSLLPMSKVEYEWKVLSPTQLIHAKNISI